MRCYGVCVLPVAIAAVAGCGNSSGDAEAKCDAESTFAFVQSQIFEARGCTASACHGAPADTAQAGLDLRAESAYRSLLSEDGLVPARSGDFALVFPSEQDLSLLYLKVEAKTRGTDLSALGIAGAPMPSSDDMLSEDDLALLRVWIRGGAPEDGILAGTEEFVTCDVAGEATPTKVEPLTPPAADEGLQFYSGGWALPAESEDEVCFVTYYDYSDRIPPERVVPCGPAYGGADRDCIAYKNVLHVQDPFSHHAIVETYIPPLNEPEQWDPNNTDFWRDWTCLGGDNAGAPCTPGGNDCGPRSQCATAPTSTVACIAYPNGPPQLGSVFGFVGQEETRINITTAQEATFREEFLEGVFAQMPVRGFVIWDSHAFNLSREDTTLEQWINVEFANSEEARFPRQQIFDADDIFGMGTIPPFRSTEICGTYTIPEGATLLTLSTHSHRFGIDFRVWYPPNDPCVSVETCSAPSRAPEYQSFLYDDPLYQRFSASGGLTFGPSIRDRTFTYCSLYDNGESNPNQVRRESTKPDSNACELVELAARVGLGAFRPQTCGCEEEVRACFGGSSQGALCNGNDGVCGEGVCDACPLAGGVTTEEEMFILLGSYAIIE